MFANACASMFVSAFWSRMSSRAVERAHLTSYCLCGVLGMLCPPPPLARIWQVTAAQYAQAASVAACAVVEQEVATLKSQLAVAQESLQSLETSSKTAQADLEQRLAGALAAASSPVGVDVATSMEEEGEDAKAAAAAAERCVRPTQHGYGLSCIPNCLFHASRAGRRPSWRRQCTHGTRSSVV